MAQQQMDMTAMADTAYGYNTAMAYPNTYKDVLSQRVGENDVNRVPTYSVADNQSDPESTIPNLSLGHGSIGHTNPLFWVLVVVLIVTGYIGFLFDFDFKKVGAVKIGVGSKH